MSDAVTKQETDRTSDRAVFLNGSTMKHVVSMTMMGSVGLIAMFFVELTDIYFLSLLHDQAIMAGMGYAATITFFTTSIGIGLSVTVSSLVSRAVGQGQQKRADRLIIHMGIFTVGFMTMLSSVVYSYIQEIVFAIGASRKTAMYAQDYLEIIIPSAVFIALAICTSGTLRAFGDGRRAMHITLIGGVVNLVLDPIFIFVMDMGIEGAALATVMSRFVMVCVGAYGIFEIHKVQMIINIKDFMEDLPLLVKFSVIAISTNLASPIGNALLMLWLAPYGDSVISAWSVYGRLVPVIFGMTFALSGAIGPIVGQNFGAGKYNRVRASVWNALVFSFVVVLGMSFLAYVGRYQLAEAFSLNTESAKFFIFLLEYVSWLFVFNGMVFIASAVFNSLGVPQYSTFFSWSRHVIGVVPFVIVGGWLYGAEGVVLFAGFGGVVFGIITYAFALRYVRKVERVCS